MMDLTKLAVWWLTQADYEAMGAIPEHLPTYIQDEVRSLNGRPGRGRLWVSPTFEKSTGVEDVTKLARQLKERDTMTPAAGAEAIERWTVLTSAGGIVIEAEHMVLLRGLPGLVTTLSYERATAGSAPPPV
jgi:hypothetical protein